METPVATPARPRLIFAPAWEGAIQKAANNFAKRNEWRLYPVYSKADIVQEAYIVFLRICNKYPMVNDPRHFMRLFMVTLTNVCHNLAAKRPAPQASLDKATINGGQTLHSMLAAPIQARDSTAFQCVPQKLAPALDAMLRLQGEVKYGPPPSAEEAKQRLAVRAAWRSLYLINRPLLPEALEARRGRLNEHLCKLTGADPETENLAELLEGWANEHLAELLGTGSV